MSFILDALRRADAERERGRVPGLNSRSPTLLDDGPPPREWPLGWMVAGAAIAVLVGAVLAWRWMAGDPPAPSPAPVPTAVSPAPAAVAAAPPAPPPMQPAPAPAPPAPPVVVLPSPPPAMEDAPRAAAPRKPPPPRREATAPARPAAPAASEPAAVAFADLPEDFRRSLPTLAIGGATYSPSPASRMLIVNGLITREGEEAAPGVTLRVIRLKSAIFESRGQRWEVSF